MKWLSFIVKGNNDCFILPWTILSQWNKAFDITIAVGTLHNENRGKTNHIFQLSNSKMYGKEP